MSQYSAGIHIKVTSPNIWRRFKGIDLGFTYDLALLADYDVVSYVFAGDDNSRNEKELYDLVMAVVGIVQNDGIVIASTTNINVDPYVFCCFYLGESVQRYEFFAERDQKSRIMCEKAYVGNILEWFKYGEFLLSKKETEMLNKLCPVIDFSDNVYLRETGFEGRCDNIEKLQIGNDVTFQLSPSEYDANRLEVICDGGSIGYLPSNISEQLVDFMGNDGVDCCAKVVEVCPLSKRNSHARSPLVAISIEVKEKNREVANEIFIMWRWS